MYPPESIKWPEPTPTSKKTKTQDLWVIVRDWDRQIARSFIRHHPDLLYVGTSRGKIMISTPLGVRGVEDLFSRAKIEAIVTPVDR